jgi:hypothetical protein
MVTTPLEHLTQRGAVERVARSIATLLPDAGVHTWLCEFGPTFSESADVQVYTRPLKLTLEVAGRVGCKPRHDHLTGAVQTRAVPRGRTSLAVGGTRKTRNLTRQTSGSKRRGAKDLACQ